MEVGGGRGRESAINEHQSQWCAQKHKGTGYITDSKKQGPSWEDNSRDVHPFMEFDGPLPCSQEIANGMLSWARRIQSTSSLFISLKICT
jgi:hypothetical protein